MSTLALGVIGSRVADDPRRLADWALVVGAALGLYLGDVLSDCEAVARDAVGLTRLSSKARVDAYYECAPPATPLVAFVALGCIAIGAVGYVLSLG